MISLDHNATTQPTPEVVAGMVRMLTELWHNPSSAHRAGQAARREVELARESVAKLLGAAPREVIFTGTSTESIDLAIRGTLAAHITRPAHGVPQNRWTAEDRPPIIITTPIEHEAVRMLCADLHRREAAEVRTLPVDRCGRVDPASLDALLADAALRARTAIVTIQWANNETGVLQDMASIARACAGHRIPLHTDATQLIGKHSLDLADPRFAGITMLSLAAHKFHGPKGVGALLVRAGTPLARMVHGVQELDRRGGTENTPGIVGMGIACDQARAWLGADGTARLRAMRDAFGRELLAAIPGAIIHARDADRLCNTISLAIPGGNAEALVLALSERGICISAGAACASGSMEPSPVLLAMGVPEHLAGGTVRISLARCTTRGELEAALPLIVESARTARAAATA